MNSAKDTLCNICFMQKGSFVTSCGCLLCGDCYKESKTYVLIEKAKCLNCQSPINYYSTINLKNINEVHSFIKGCASEKQKLFVLDIMKVILFLNYSIASGVIQRKNHIVFRRTTEKFS